MPKKSHYEKLRDKWIGQHQALQEKLWARHGEAFHSLVNTTRSFAAGSLGSLLLLTSPALPALPSQVSSVIANENAPHEFDKSTFFVTDLMNALPKEVQPLTGPEEKATLSILNRDFDVRVTPELQGIRLERNYGYIGMEQHLARYPGDTLETHFDNAVDAQLYGKQGMAPGLGAWGYFARSFDSLTEEDKAREKYYIAVQTFIAPGFDENVREYITFFKYRKMLIVNPQNGRAMVVVIGDAGPGRSTGKQFGGSPEVMKYLERVDGRQKGPVIVYFLEDPDNTVPLGPVSLK